MNKTAIEWVKNPDGSQGYTWNPITGCLNHTPDGLCLGGMFPCYAWKLAHTRLKERYLANEEYAPVDVSNLDMIDPADDPFYPRFWPERLEELYPSHATLKTSRYHRDIEPKGIFPCDMSDLFGLAIPEDWTRQVMEVIEDCPQHRFYLLTKQAQNLAEWLPFPPNCWVGVTATNEHFLVEALNRLIWIEAKVRFISFEPLLGSALPQGWHTRLPSIDWVIIGAQTKPYRPPRIEWVREIVEAADRTGIPVFLKDNLKPLLRNDDGWTPALFISARDCNGEEWLRQELPKEG